MMQTRRPVFPHVIELSYQAGRRLGCNIYVVYDDQAWAIIDIGYEDVVDEVVDLIRDLDFPFSKCVGMIATHADVDHSQGFAKLKQVLRAPVFAHPVAADLLRRGDRLATCAQIPACGIDLPMPPVEVEQEVSEGDAISIGSLSLGVWHTPGHTHGQLGFRLGELLFSADNIYRDGCVGAVDAHHGSNLPDFIASLRRIRASDCKWLLPSHGPIFAKDDDLLDRAVARLESYMHMADFGVCAQDWPLLDEWDRELAEGRMPG